MFVLLEKYFKFGLMLYFIKLSLIELLIKLCFKEKLKYGIYKINMHQLKYKQGVKARLIIHEILYSIKYQNKSFDQIFKLKKESENLKSSDWKLINDVVLSSMRFFLYVNKIINVLSKKKPRKDQYILLLSSITQLLYLNYKSYAVIVDILLNNI